MIEFSSEDLRRHIALLSHQHGEIEIVALDANRRHAQAGRFDNINACVHECERLNGKMNLYLRLQKVGHWQYPLDNKIQYRRAFTRDIDIGAVTTIMLDIDAVRPPGLNATDKEIQETYEYVMLISGLIFELKIPQPIIIGTGNGFQIYLPLSPVPLSSTVEREHVSHLLRAFERFIRQKAREFHVRIDTVSNLAHLARACGMLNVKYIPTADRPQRLCKIWYAPETRQETTLEQITNIIGDYAVKNSTGEVSPADSMPPLTGSTRPSCSAVKKLWTKGYPPDRSRAIWAMCLVMGFWNEPPEVAIAALLKFNQMVRKLNDPRAARKYMSYWYDRARHGDPCIPCQWLRTTGFCPGIARCDWDKVKVALDLGGLSACPMPAPNEEGNFNMLINPQQISKNLAVTPGEYAATIVDFFEGVSKSSGAKMANIILETKGDNSFRVYDHFVDAHPVAQRRLLALLTALGLQNEEHIEEKDLIGKSLVISVVMEKDPGMPPQPRVKRFMPLAEQPSGK